MFYRLRNYVACRKEHMRDSAFFCTPELIQQLQEKVMKEPSYEMWDLVREMSVAISTLKLALNKDLCYPVIQEVLRSTEKA